MIEIFNKMLFGVDADWFYNLPKTDKLEWISKNTNQTNELLINEFLTNLKKPCDCGCLDCGKNKANVNISKSNVIEVANSIERGLDEKPSAINNIKRPKESKGRKDNGI